MPQTQAPEMPPSPESERFEFEMITSTDPLAGLIWVDPERMSGIPCFAGTRVPVKHLWDYLEAGEPLGEFLDGFPGVTREQAIGVLEIAFQRMVEGFPQP
jgi:uncharacterized protein (DUF433 family)